jgi:metal-responsive CopG/Arc/MetJ family transcriptional regulator
MITSVKEPPASYKVIPPLGAGSAKVSISLPRQLLAFADQLAEETSKSRSEVVAGLLRKEEEARIEALMIEGYRAMAEENLREAEESMHAASEVILRDG